MATIEPLAMFMDIFRIAVAFGFIIFLIIIFFSFKVDVKGDTMKRFVVELSDSLASSPLTDQKSIFNPQKLTEVENMDIKRNIEPYSRSCDYGYYAEIESLAGRTECSRNSDCSGFCGNVCGISGISFGITGNCNCNVEILGDNFCECKKPDRGWQDTYKWDYGYKPSDHLATATSEFPIGINIQGSAVPASLRLTAYDTFLTRLSCITHKAYELKDTFWMKFAASYVHFTSSPVFERKNNENHACIYSLDARGDEITLDCRHMPGIPFEKFEILRGLPVGGEGTITAYPVTRVATCAEINSNPSLIARESENVETVVLCMGAKR